MQTEPNPTPYFAQGGNAAGAAGTAGATGAAAGEVSRRALIVTAGLGVCAAGCVATPIALKYAADQAGAALQNGVSQGIQEGKDLALAGLDELGDISLEAAIGVAEVTKLGIKYVMQPLATLVATIGGDAINIIAGGLDALRNGAAFFGVHNAQADQLSSLLHNWHDNLDKLPIQLANYATTDVDSAEAYLKSLKAQVDAAKANIGKHGTPTPTTPTPTSPSATTTPTT